VISQFPGYRHRRKTIGVVVVASGVLESRIRGWCEVVI
jgi:hypothetical protein